MGGVKKEKKPAEQKREDSGEPDMQRKEDKIEIARNSKIRRERKKQSMS